MKAFERQVRWAFDLARKRVGDQRDAAIEMIRDDCHGCTDDWMVLEGDPPGRPHTCTAKISEVQNTSNGHLQQLDELLETILRKAT